MADVRTAIIGADLLTRYDLILDLRRHRIYDPLTSVNARSHLHKASLHSVFVIDSPTAEDHQLSAPYRKLLLRFLDLTKPRGFPSTNSTLEVQYHVPSSHHPRQLTGKKLRTAKGYIDLFFQ